MKKIIKYLIVMVVALGFVTIVSSGFYILREGDQAVITQLGKPVGEPVTTAGFHFKIPYIQKVTRFEKRILIWNGEPNQIVTNDKTYIYLFITARWRISDALVFLQAVNDERRAQSILDDIIAGTARDLVNKNDLDDIIRSSDWSAETLAAIPDTGKREPIRTGRDKITNIIQEVASKQTPRYGIELIDVMLKRVNYTDSVRKIVYNRMISERKRIAAEERSIGEGKKEEIIGKIQKELQEIISQAKKEAAEIKGKADGDAARIYAEAYNADPDFYAFYNTLESFKKTMSNNTQLILADDSQFYKYLKDLK